jgi:hypothetical protein
MSHDDSDPGHGNSPAAWTGVIIMLVGFTVGTIAFVADLPIIVWASAGLVLLGAIAGWVLKKLGYGVGGDKLTPPQVHS